MHRPSLRHISPLYRFVSGFLVIAHVMSLCPVQILANEISSQRVSAPLVVWPSPSPPPSVAAKTLNRVAMVTYPDGTTDKVLYNRLDPQWRKDRLGRWTEMLYDNMRRLSVVVDPLSRVTQYQWCVCGSLEVLIDPAGNRTRWTRDEQRRVIQKTYPDASAVYFSYENRTSRQKSVLDAKGQKTNYQYNIDNTLNQVSYTDASGAALSPATPGVSFTYDSAYPRVATMADGIGTTQYGYNAVSAPPALGAGRVATIDGPWANDTIAYTYDKLGRVLSRSINGAANTASMTYDTLGRVSAASNVLGAFSYSYVNATGRLSQATLPNGQTTQFQYFGNSGDQRLKEIKNLTSAAAVISQFDYTYNAVGDITTWTQNNPVLPNPRQYVFGYDAADQLTAASLTDTVTSGSLADQGGKGSGDIS